MYTTEETSVFSDSKESAYTKVVIPKGTSIYVTKGTSKRSKIKWNNYSGWISNTSYSYYKPSPLATRVPRDTSSTSSTTKANDYRPNNASGGTVQVKGYYRKNGTYVRPHTRSAPRRR